MIFRNAANEADIRQAIDIWYGIYPPDDAEDEAAGFQQMVAIFKSCPEGFWVAEEAGHIVGLAGAVRRPPQWMLTSFFVDEKLRGQGIGHALIEKAIAAHEGCDRFLVHASTHEHAQSLYLHYGMYPQAHSTYFHGRPKNLIPPPLGITAERCNLNDVLPIVNAYDKGALGFTRAVDHRWWATRGDYFLFQAGGETVGYFCVSPRGEIGPLVVADVRWMAGALDLAIMAALERTSREQYILVPGANMTAIARLVGYGYRFLEVELLMSSHPLPGLSRVIFFDTDLL